MRSSLALNLVIICALGCFCLLSAGCQYCAVHRELLRWDNVPVYYGLILPSEDHREASKDFPNANTWSPGGCCSFPEAPQTEKVLYCEACRRAEARWLRSQRSQPDQ